MLLNLSNHSVNTWSDEQKHAAHAEFGAVKDMPFPVIAPEWDRQKVHELADEYTDKVMDAQCQAVLLAGEQSFLVALTERLGKKGIPVFCACSERISETLADGRKAVAFHFVRFRRMDKN